MVIKASNELMDMYPHLNMKVIKVEEEELPKQEEE
jgi:hypothetical protein